MSSNEVSASLLWASPEYVDRVLARARQCDALEAERDALRARVADLEAAQRWIPVTERLPEYGSNVLAWAPGWITCAEVYRAIDDGFISAAGEVALPGVTHWRPLPAGPEVQP